MKSNHKKDKAVIGGRIRFIVVFRNWIHQGFTYLDKTEKFYRIIWELIPLFFAYNVFSMYDLKQWQNIILSFLVAHTLNWIFNDNFWTCIQFTLPNLLNPGNEKTKEYLKGMQTRMNRCSCVGGCLIFGSMSRGTWKEKSDLDIRILRKPGIINGFMGYCVCWFERIIAVYKKQPLDIYLADDIEFLRKMRKDEFPIFIKTDDDRLILEYGIVKNADFTIINHLNELSNQ